MAFAHGWQDRDSEAMDVFRSWLRAGLRFSIASEEGECVVCVKGERVVRHADPAQAVLWAVEELRCRSEGEADDRRPS